MRRTGNPSDAVLNLSKVFVLLSLFSSNTQTDLLVKCDE